MILVVFSTLFFLFINVSLIMKLIKQRVLCKKCQIKGVITSIKSVVEGGQTAAALIIEYEYENNTLVIERRIGTFDFLWKKGEEINLGIRPTGEVTICDWRWDFLYYILLVGCCVLLLIAISYLV